MASTLSSLPVELVYVGFSWACVGLFAQFTWLNRNAQFEQFTCWIHDFSELNRPGRNDTDNKLFLAKHGIETWSTGQAFIKLVYNVLKVSKRISKHWPILCQETSFVASFRPDQVNLEDRRFATMCVFTNASHATSRLESGAQCLDIRLLTFNTL